MKDLFKTGDKKQFIRRVGNEDLAAFNGEAVHQVYATFSMARDAEWCCRLFVLEMKEADEEGIGTYVHVNHHAPALLGSEIVFEAEITEIKGNAVHCKWKAEHNGRLLGSGTQGQKILKKEKIEQLFQSLNS